MSCQVVSGCVRLCQVSVRFLSGSCQVPVTLLSGRRPALSASVLSPRRCSPARNKRCFSFRIALRRATKAPKYSRRLRRRDGFRVPLLERAAAFCRLVAVGVAGSINRGSPRDNLQRASWLIRSGSGRPEGCKRWRAEAAPDRHGPGRERERGREGERESRRRPVGSAVGTP